MYFFILTPNVVMADEAYKQEIVKINGISMYKKGADKILENTKDEVLAVSFFVVNYLVNRLIYLKEVTFFQTLF